MWLDRIELLSKDDRFKDISEVFNKILPDEMYHTKAFKALSTPECIQRAMTNHKNGLNAIGLII